MRRGFTLVELLVVFIVLAIGASLFVPSLFKARRAQNERDASGALKQIGSAEITFKSSDLDHNGISDYWTADLRGLHFIRDDNGQRVRLIEQPIAIADGNPEPATDYSDGGARGFPHSGYWFQALRSYEIEQATSLPYGRKHPDRFSFGAFPAHYELDGRAIFITSEGCTQFRCDPGSPASYYLVPPATREQDPGGILNGEFDAFPFTPSSRPWGWAG